MGKATPYEMSDEEYEVFEDRFNKVMEALDSTAGHLVGPLLIRALVITHLSMKGIPQTDVTTILANNLIVEISNIIFNTTERYLQELN